MKTALIDVCDVIVDLRGYTFETLSLSIPSDAIPSWDIFDILPAEDCKRVRQLYDDPDFWKGLPLVSHAVEGVEGLRQMGYHVHFVTSPWYTCENWENIRRNYLSQHFSWFRKNDMTVTAEKFRVFGDILIDDRPKHVKLWQAQYPQSTAFLFDIQFNRHFNWPRRCKWSPAGALTIPIL
jgi:5'(3')-deoxyribonucleotidase